MKTPHPLRSFARSKPARPTSQARRSQAVISAAALLLALPSVRAADGANLFDLSLDQLSQVEIKSDLTSIKAKSVREQPGIVSVVTAKEIGETGARDLAEVLLLVPGFALDTDVQSMVGLTFRGLQGQEGKVLLVLDGIEMNEPLYGSLPILNHVPADAIEQLEIIRGPGSAIYGGTAGLAVIRVTTKGAAQNGGYAVASPSFAGDRFAQQVAAGLGYTTNDWRVSLNTSYRDDFLSNHRYTSLAGTELDLTRRSDMKPLFLDLGAGWRDLDVRVIYDAYRYDDAVNYGDPPVNSIDTRFDSILANAKYNAQVTDWLKLTPQFTYRHQVPWHTQSEELGTYQIETDRYQADFTGVAQLNDHSGLMAGLRYQRDTACALDTFSAGRLASEYYHGLSSIAYDDLAGFAQYDLDTRWVNLSLGGRYEYHDAVGGHFVPRAALTKAWRKFHLKALYSQANRTPGINVVNDAIGGQIQAEQTTNYELESGYRFSDSLSLVGNLFYMRLNKPILFSADSSGSSSDGYSNGSQLSTYGLETEVRWSQPAFSTYLSYSFYRPNENDIEAVRGDSARFLAAPSHKVGLSGTWHLNKSLDWNVSGFWLSERLAYAFPSGGLAVLDSEFVLNTFLNYRYRQFSFGLGVANLLDTDRYAPQPYNGGSGPLPLKGREVFAKLAVHF